MRTTTIAAITLAIASSALASSQLDARYYVDTDATATTTTADVASSSGATEPTAAPTNRLLDRIKQAAQQGNIDHGPAMAIPNIGREVETPVRRYNWNPAWGIGPVVPPQKSLDQNPPQPQADIVKRYLERRIAASVLPDDQDMYRSPGIMSPQADIPRQDSTPTPTHDPTPSSSSAAPSSTDEHTSYDPLDRDRRVPRELGPTRVIRQRELAEDSYPGPTPQLRRRAWQSRRRSLYTLNELD
ncbi:hypothetical protein K474DRAFT_1042778 [Panus rudis PR-1116 ss-1]|nr:hypothetical protein K474DRAFT_1042778 [Panus rudis PR-1116 ss-1]